MGVIRNKKAFLAFLLPGLLFYILAVFYPIEESIRLSFMKWGGIGKKQFVGLQNYVTMFHDEVFYKAFFNNLIYLVIVVSMQLLIGLFFAILLTYMTKHVTLVKTLYYVPCIITTVAITQLFRSMYSTEPMGLLNQILQKVGLGGMVTSWLAKVSTVLPAVSIPEGWRFTGMYMVIFYAALVSLDPSVYEAAKIDGASEMQILFKIKMPLIKDIVLLTLTMCLTGALRGFDIPFLLTSGGPGNASELMSTYMYKKAFSSNQYGYGSTLAVFIIIESILVVYILRKIFTSKEQKEEKRTILPECLLVDGYNIIFSWDELNELSKTNLDHARTRLMEMLNNYQGYRKCLLIVVFDAYKIKKNVGSFEKNDNIYVVYTKEAQTADNYIEKVTHDLAENYRVYVATSDALEQTIVFSRGAMRISAREFELLVKETHENELKEFNRKNKQMKNYLLEDLQKYKD